MQLIELVDRHEAVFLSDRLAIQSDRVQSEELEGLLLEVVSYDQVFLCAIERIGQLFGKYLHLFGIWKDELV